jgi:hypothetical protein
MGGRPPTANPRGGCTTLGVPRGGPDHPHASRGWSWPPLMASGLSALPPEDLASPPRGTLEVVRPPPGFAMGGRPPIGVVSHPDSKIFFFFKT